MQKLTEIKDLYENPSSYAGKRITIGGWVRSVRSSKTFGFIVVGDGTCFRTLQVVYSDSLENFDEAASLKVSTSVIISGDLTETPKNRQPFELLAKELKVEGSCDFDYPLQKKRHTMEFLRGMLHLRPRTNTFQAVFRVRSVVSYLIHSFFQERGFVYVHTPIITSLDCEGAGEMFKVTSMDLNKLQKNGSEAADFSRDFFRRPVSLTVSGQLDAEAYAAAFRKVYTFGPTFRAENSNTTRHAAEFWMVEPEIAFAELDDDMDLAEDMLKYIITGLLKEAPDEMSFFNSYIDKDLIERLLNVAESRFERITYGEAVRILEKNNENFKYKASWGADLSTEHEKYLTESVFKKPVFVTDYPKEIKAFYMKQNKDGKTVAAVDCLVPGIGEIIGGSQREDDLQKLVKRMRETGLDETEYGFYTDLRRYGSVRHAGFGLGFERCMMYLTGMKNIRDVIPFPRTAGVCEL